MNTIKGFGKKWLQQPPTSGQKLKKAIGDDEIAGSLKALFEFHQHFDKIFIREEQSAWSLFMAALGLSRRICRCDLGMFFAVVDSVNQCVYAS